MKSPLRSLTLTFAIFTIVVSVPITLRAQVAANGRIVFTSTRDAGATKIFSMKSDGSDVKQLTSTFAVDPAVSPNGARIAFTRRTLGTFDSSEIIVMNADGSTANRLTFNTTADVQPSWSPDGTKIAFTSYRDSSGGVNNQEIYVMNADGTNQVNLTNNSPGVQDFLPKWSPLGDKILFSRALDGSTDAEVFVMNADGTNPHDITNNPASDIAYGWSPDGTKILFRRGFDPDPANNLEIFVMNSDGSNQTRLTFNSFTDTQPRWSPDGSKITFLSNRDGNFQIYVMDADGSNQTNLTNSSFSEQQADWQPLKANGRIAFTSTRTANTPFLYSMNPSGTGVTGLLTSGRGVTETVWSPDGTKIAFSRQTSNAGTSREIFMLDITTNVVTQLTFNSTIDNQPTWSPDGKWIAYTAHQDSDPNGGTTQEKIYKLEVANPANQSRLTDLGGGTQEFFPEWSPTGNKILFTRQIGTNPNTDVFVKDLSTGVEINATNNPSSNIAYGWSPDGTKIAFRSNRVSSDPTDSNGDLEIYVMDSDGSNQRQLTFNSATDTRPVFSPDGTKIAFLSTQAGDSGEVFVMDADGSNQHNVTNAPAANDDFPTWAPLLASGTVPGNNTIVSGDVSLTFSGVTAAGTTAAVPIDPVSAGPLPAGFAIDGTSIAFEINTTAAVTPPINICFNVQSVNDAAVFSNLRVLHREDGVLVDRTTTNDFASRTVCATTSSLSPFLVAQLTDHTSPVTAASISGVVGDNGWYKSDVMVTLVAADNAGGSGIRQIAYSLNGSMPTVVTGSSTSVAVSSEGTTVINYFATDNVGNVEAAKTLSLKIDKTAPIISLTANPAMIWPPNGKTVNVTIGGNGSDAISGLGSVTYVVTDEYGLPLTIAPRILGGMSAVWTENLGIEARRDGNDHDGRLYRVTATIKDAAGNTATASTDIVVPHDQGK